MGLFDRSSSSNVTNLTDATTTNTTQTDQSGVSGMAFSDIAGAVGLEFNETLTSYESNTVTDHGAVSSGRDVALAGISAVQRANADSLELLAGLAQGSIDASKTIARDSAASAENFLSQAIAGFGSLAKQTSEGSDDKIARVVGFALAAVAAVVVLPALFKGGGKAAVI